MNRHPQVLMVTGAIVAFIAGYAIVSYIIRKLRANR